MIKASRNTENEKLSSEASEIRFHEIGEAQIAKGLDRNVHVIRIFP